MAFDPKRLEYLNKRLDDLPEGYIQEALDIGRQGGPDPISGTLLIAISVRESGLRCVLGDQGRARGSHQFLDTYHSEFLRTVPGCKAAATIKEHTHENWKQQRGKNALMRGYAPGWAHSCGYCADILNGLFDQAIREDVQDEDALHVALSAYNVGMTRALRGYEEHYSSDHYTTGKDYGRDVLLRRSEINHLLLKRGYKL